MSPFAHPLVPTVLSIILVSITFSLRPDEAMFFAVAKVVFAHKYFLFNAFIRGIVIHIGCQAECKTYIYIIMLYNI